MYEKKKTTIKPHKSKGLVKLTDIAKCAREVLAGSPFTDGETKYSRNSTAFASTGL